MPAPGRRRPRQARSRATVERILDAAARVLAADGFAAASTNAIAREAEVSPGTLYGYFADRDAILVELTGRVIERFEAALTPALRRVAGLSPVQARRELIAAVLTALAADADVLRVLVDRVPGVEQSQRLHSIRQRLLDAIHRLLVVDGVAVQDADAAAWFVLEIAQHLAVRYVLDRPGIPPDAFAQRLERVLAAAGEAPGAFSWSVPQIPVDSRHA